MERIFTQCCGNPSVAMVSNMELTERNLRILQAIVADFISSAEPVGSRTLAKKYDMGVSHATIRNEMSALEEQGYLTFTAGNVTDYDYILNDLLSYPYRIYAVYYDTYNATQFAISATQQGINMIPYSQTTGSFNKPTKEMDRLILTGAAVFNPNPLTLFCYRNVKLRQDYLGNVKQDKSYRVKKIDGVIAQLMSLAGYLLNPVAPSVH